MNARIRLAVANARIAYLRWRYLRTGSPLKQALPSFVVALLILPFPSLRESLAAGGLGDPLASFAAALDWMDVVFYVIAAGLGARALDALFSPDASSSEKLAAAERAEAKIKELSRAADEAEIDVATGPAKPSASVRRPRL